MSADSNVLVDVRDGIAVLTINRPGRLNALDSPTRILLAERLRQLGSGDDAEAVIVTGAGRAFCVGDDLTTLLTEVTDRQAAVRTINEFHDLTRAVMQSRVPMAAAVNGPALGGAFEWLLSFDWRVGCPATVLTAPENLVGLTISNAGSYLLGHMLRAADVSRVVLDCEAIDAAEAHALGLLDLLVDADVVTAAELHLRSWTRPGSATRHHLAMIRPDPDLLEAAMERETEAFALAWDEGLVTQAVRNFTSRQRGAPFRGSAADGQATTGPTTSDLATSPIPTLENT